MPVVLPNRRRLTSRIPPPPVFNTYSILYDGTSEVVRTSGTTIDIDYDDSTWSIWAATSVNTITNRNIIHYVHNVTSRELGFRLVSGNNINVFDGTALRLASVGTLSLGVWTHVALTFHDNLDGSAEFILYLDGVYDSSASTTYSPFASGSGLGIGAHFNGGQRYWKGNLDEPNIWGKVFNQAEITELYNIAAPYDLNQHSAAASLLHWWRMGDDDTYPDISDVATGGTAIELIMVDMEAEDIVEDVP